MPFRLEDLVDGEDVASLEVAEQLRVLDPHLLEVAEDGGAGLLEDAQLRLGETVGVLLVDRAEAQDDGIVAVLLGGLAADDGARTALEHGDRDAVAGGVEDLGHADLLRQETCSHEDLAVVRPAAAGRGGRAIE